MTTDSLKLHRRARFALWGLDPDEQARVRERLAMLANLPRSEWPADIVLRLPSNPALYLVRVDDNWRLIIGDDDGRALVEEIVHQDRLDLDAQASKKNSH